MQNKKYPFILIFIITINFSLLAQDVYQHISNKNIYEFVDELANQGIIEINSAIKPYSRSFIAGKLAQAASDEQKLNKRQKKEIGFYLLEYKLEVDSVPDYNPKFDLFGKNKNLATAVNPLGLFYKDKLFTLSVKPIWGINYFFNENGSIYHRWGGGEAFGYIGKHWGFYASLRDNSESKRISEADFFTLRPGGAYKITTGGGGDYSEMRGGVTFSWRWGSVGLVKDHLTWGTNYHGANIFTDRAPSFAQIKLSVKPVKWFELNYYHGWLVSMEVDSVRSYYSTNPPREVYRPKYIAANMFTFTPWKRLNISVGNSIIYSDMNVHPAYLIPVMFFKSIDHTVNQDIDNQNSQMFFDISSRNIKKVHLYGTLFIDELKIERISQKDEYNFYSVKIGAATSNLGIQNLSLNVEYTMSMPLTYQHRVPTLTYESNYYNMGFYLRDNSQEIFARIAYKPIRGLHLSAYYLLAQHGPDYIYDVNNPDEKANSHPLMEYVTWQNQTISFKATYEFINNAYLFVEYISADITGDEEQVIKYTPEFFRGKTNTISAGFNVGF
ncbi:MAG: hypothetical protein JW731_11075 [Bacteroidales bacterium]|nr:hypothetical protein [Bacteroidales bacterium]